MHKLKILLTITIFVITLLFNFNAMFAHAEVDLGGALDRAGSGLYGDNEAARTKSLPALIGSVIKILLSTLGVILVGIVVYAGYLWMTAGGDEKKVDKAKDWLKNAIIGVVIIMSAYALTDYVMAKLIAASIQ